MTDANPKLKQKPAALGQWDCPLQFSDMLRVQLLPAEQKVWKHGVGEVYCNTQIACKEYGVVLSKCDSVYTTHGKIRRLHYWYLVVAHL